MRFEAMTSGKADSALDVALRVAAALEALGV